MFNQKLFSILQVAAQALFSFSFLSTLIKSANEVNYVDWSVSFSIASAIFSLNIFSGVLFNKFIASGHYSTNIIFLNGLGLIIISSCSARNVLISSRSLVINVGGISSWNSVATSFSGELRTELG